MKVLKIILIGIFLLTSGPAGPVCYAAEIVAGLFEPCQYKNIYIYYLEKGDAHLADNQPHAALEAYKRALMIQPVSEEAMAKIEYVEGFLGLKQQKKITAKETPAEAARVTRESKDIRTREGAMLEALDSVTRERQYKPDITTLGEDETVVVKRPSVRKRTAITTQKTTSAQQAQPSYTSSNWPGPCSFSNGIDESIQEGVKSINDEIAPGKISGDYRVALGFTSDDVIWNDANNNHIGVPIELNWRYLYGENQYNMYDKEIYSRLRVEADGPITAHTKGFTEIVFDPWTYVGRKDVESRAANGDAAHLTLKYWSNAKRCINEMYRSDRGDIVNVQENKIVEGKLSPESYFGLFDWGSNSFPVGEADIDRMYVPIRKLWFDYDNEPNHLRIFPMANEDQALTTDDPLRLSNNKAWWEESPWLDSYEPSRVFQRPGAPVKQGEWVRSLSFTTKDSDFERLTFLRGVNFSTRSNNGIEVETTVAAPRSLWDYYDEVSSVPGAIRLRLPETEDIKAGALYTSKLGLRENSVEAVNHLAGIDGEYFHSPDTSAYAQCAFSYTDIEEANGVGRNYWGAGYTLGLKNKGNLASLLINDDYDLNLSFTHFNDNFLPGLSNYRFTRKDTIYAKHIYFDKLQPEVENEKVGNGVDIDRVAFNANAKANFLDEKLKTTADFRDVRTDSGNFIENVTRAEAEYKFAPKLTGKGLFRYEHLPETTEGYDPLMNAKTSYSAFTDYFSDKDIWLRNNAVEEGKDPSIGAYSLGLKYDPFDTLSLQAIYEATNDPLDMPRGLLNDAYVTNVEKDGILWDEIVPFLHDQGSFGLPPYEYYNIYKGRVVYYPIKDILKADFSYVYNENKYATTLDDNVTHTGINLDYKYNAKLTLGLAYYYTRIRELWTDVIGGQGYHYDGHHNVFLAADYNINENQTFTLMFGEFAGYGGEYYDEYSPIGPLDTQHIVRAIYSGKF
ncbi:MAG: hypothetical protein V2A72_07665 [Candidatus Omnitrophota bacterium]